jgi:hypothetical protein
MLRHVLPVALLVACEREVYTPPVDSDPTADSDSPVETVQAALAFVEATFPPADVRSGLVAQGGVLYARRNAAPEIEVSENGGRSWHSGVAVDSQLVTTATAVYSLDANGLIRLADAGRSKVSLPLPDGLSRSDIRQIVADASGALWLSTLDVPLVMYRSTDGGETFSEVDFPDEITSPWFCPAAGGPLTTIREGTDVMQWDGSTFQSVGTVTDAMECFVTAAGTILVVDGYPGTQYRLPAGATEWETSEMPEYATFQQVGDDVLRIVPGGGVETSADDGVTWTPRTSADWMYVYFGYVPLGDALVGLRRDNATQTQMLATLAADSTQWTYETIFGLPRREVVDLSFAQATGRMGMLIRNNVRIQLCMHRGDAGWVCGLDFAEAEAQTLSVSPDGQRAFVGGINGRFTIAAEDGSIVDHGGTIDTSGGGPEMLPIRSSAWTEIAGSQVVIASTANDDDSDGRIFWYDEYGQTWYSKTPTSTVDSLAVRPGGYRAIAALKQDSVGLFAYHNSWYTTNGWIANLLETYSIFDTSPLWFEADSAYGLPVRSASYSPTTSNLAVLWDYGLLYLGRDFRELSEVTANIPLDSKVARFDHEGYLWIGHPTGLLKSTAPVAALP